MKRIRFLLLFALLLTGVLVVSQLAPAVAAPAQQTNLLNNPSFEDPYSNGAASGWGRWHEERGPKPENCSAPYAFRPSWSREGNGALVVDGSISQHVGNQFDTWHAGVAQTLSVTPGSRYRFSFWAIGRATNDQFPAPSDGSVNMGVRAGIDPNGSGLWNDGDVVWGPAGSPHDDGSHTAWQQFSVEATAATAQITVFVSANFVGANQCRAHLDVWFDNAQLVEAGPPPTNTPPPQPTAPPPPPVTNTPVPPTATATPAETATNTPVPTETPTLTPTTPPGGTICVNAFADANANGQKEDTEGAMAGVTFTIARDSEIVGQGVSAGPDPLCFDALEPGNYQVAQTVPNTLEMTTGANTGISLTAGETVMVAFGSRVKGDVSSADTVSSETVTTDTGGPTAPAGVADEDDGGSSLLAISGLAAIFLAVIMLGALIFLLLRQRA